MFLTDVSASRVQSNSLEAVCVLIEKIWNAKSEYNISNLNIQVTAGSNSIPSGEMLSNVESHFTVQELITNQTVSI